MNAKLARKMTAGAVLSLLLCLISTGCSDPKTEIADRERAGGTDVTFFVAADTHFGFQGLDAVNKRQINVMNSLPGREYPPAIGGVIAKPLGVLIAGDLTDNGLPGEWKKFVKHYGLTGEDGLLKYPVYECTGNHDREMPLGKPVLDGVKKRHGSLTYSWNWGDVHLVCLDEYPDGGNLRWLRRDLAKVGRKIPVVIFFHFPLLGPYSNSWSGREKEAFRKVIDGFNVVGIFHGHYHGSQHYVWAGYDVYNVGSPRHGRHSFAVVHITDTKMTVASWKWETFVPVLHSARPLWTRGPGGWGWTHSKPINQGK